MEQHHIQSAYLKRFENNGKLFVYDSKTCECKKQPRRFCTVETDFQLEFHEQLQNEEIEKPGIEIIRKLERNCSLNEKDLNVLYSWVALHLVRNQKRKNLIFNSKDEYNELIIARLTEDLIYLTKFPCVSIYTCSKNEFFVTSDNPILEVCFENDPAFLLPISPDKLLVFNCRKDIVYHQEIRFDEIINSMILASSYKHIYSDRPIDAFDKWNENIIKFNLKPKEEEIKFKLDCF
ncbi:MAG: hypothetical protein KBH06_05340 [Spirochaetes bacterium]|nr:hypothetical protein [Spirochaetota bacterium]